MSVLLSHFQHFLASGLLPGIFQCNCASNPTQNECKGGQSGSLQTFCRLPSRGVAVRTNRERERARRDAQLRYVVIYWAACSYCLARAERLDGSYLRTFALELKEQLAQRLAAFVTSILTQPRRRLHTESAAEPPLRQINEVLQQVMYTHDAEKLGIAVLEIYEGGHREERSSKR